MLCSEIPVKFILGVFNAKIVDSTFQCNVMHWLITMKCCGTMELRPILDCASFWVLLCLVGEARHSGAIPCAMIGWKFYQYISTPNICLNIILFLLSYGLCS